MPEIQHTKEDIPYAFVTFEELKELIDPEKPLMFDTETVGLYGKIRLAQFFQEHFEGAMLIQWPDPMQLVALLTKLHTVCHNAHYDISTIQENLDNLAWMPETFDCTFLLARLYYYNKEKFSLDDVVEYVLGEDIYGGTKKDMHKENWDVPVLTDEQLTYASRDVIHLLEVYNTVIASEDDISYKLDILATRYCLDFQNNGLPFDEDKLNDRYAKNTARIEEIGLPINANSYQQVRPYIGSNQSDGKGLALLSIQGNERARDVQETRKLIKNNSFLTKFLNTAREGCIFGKFKMSARSGRSTSDDQNLQQLPRNLKGIFGVDTESDEVLIYSDFAQIQLRGVCVVTGDTTMEKLFRDGADMHNYVAEMIFGSEFTKRDRQIAKTANFGLLFGAGVAVFQSVLIKDANLFLSEEECMKIKKKWIKLWVQIAEWQQKGFKDHAKKVAWETPLGRRYIARMGTDQLAMQIQGFESEVAKLAMHYMWPKLEELSPDIKLRNFIHDSYIFSCPKDSELYEPACEIIADCMQEAWHEMCQSVKITDLPMPTNVRVGYNWGDIENDEFIYEINK